MECRVSEGEGNWELNRAALQMGKKGRETDTANERQEARERKKRELMSLDYVEVWTLIYSSCSV